MWHAVYEMSAVKDRDKVHEGAEVAKDLGWPEDQIGPVAAVGGLLGGLAAEWQVPRSSMRRVWRYRSRSQSAVHDRLMDSIRRVSK